MDSACKANRFGRYKTLQFMVLAKIPIRIAILIGSDSTCYH